MTACLSTILPILAIAVSAPASLPLADRLADARPGDVIALEGVHRLAAPLAIQRPLTLLGTNRAVIEGPGRGCTILVIASNVVLRGLTIRNSGRDLNSLDSAIMILGSGAEVSDCAIEADGFGVFLRGASRCRVERNQIRGNPALHPSARGNGIHLWKTKENVVRENRISEVRDGIYFSFADRNEIAANRVERTRFAIHYMYSHFNRLISNSLAGNAVGATLMFSQYSLIQGNRAHANTRHGMLFKQLDNSKVIGNVVSGQNRGFFVQQAAGNRFADNIIATNDIGVYLSNGSEQNVFVGNLFLNNVDQVWQPDYEKDLGAGSRNTFYENGRGNFWSDYAGADAQGDGIGDTPYHETDVYGYLLDRYPEARIFALSPAVAVLRKTEQLLPVLNLPGVVDLHPLAQPWKGSR